MAKKQSYPTSKKKVSVKKIIADIEKAINALETRAMKPNDPMREIERARKALGAARDAVESACLPEFYLPTS
jgi:hypothetical protein